MRETGEPSVRPIDLSGYVIVSCLAERAVGSPETLQGSCRSSRAAPPLDFPADINSYPQMVARYCHIPGVRRPLATSLLSDHVCASTIAAAGHSKSGT
jgi:hypothetical protein